MHQFKVRAEDIKKDYLEIIGDEAHHLLSVLRLNQGDTISVFDGQGSKAYGIIHSFDKNAVKVRLLKQEVSNAEPPIRVTLYQGMPKKDKFDLIIQKATELGVYTIIPLVSKRTVVNIKQDKLKQRMQRWNKIAAEACKQCGRAYIPAVQEPTGFANVLDEIQKKTSFIFWEGEQDAKLKGLLNEYKGQSPLDIGILVGPEGGWDDDEVNRAKAAGAKPVSLGSRILRTETAGLVALTMLMYELGDLGE